jgi:hypothetical protein
MESYKEGKIISRSGKNAFFKSSPVDENWVHGCFQYGCLMSNRVEWWSGISVAEVLFEG